MPTERDGPGTCTSTLRPRGQCFQSSLPHCQSRCDAAQKAQLKIVCAPDSFKKSMSIAQAAVALAEGVRRVAPGAECAKIPMADGGEGFAESLTDALGPPAVRAPVLDAYGRPVLARFAPAEGLAVMERVQAIGFGMIPPERHRVCEASTFGVGQMIPATLDGGAREFFFGIGGSATNDGGAGMLRALGVRFLDAEGRELDGSPAPLARLDSIDASGLDPRTVAATFKIACDVDNLLLGLYGSSAAYRPQKGAFPEDVAFLDGTLGRLAGTAGHLDSFAAVPGVGTAGGLDYAFSVFLGGELQSGTDLVVEVAGLAEAVKGAGFAFTGEGAMDRQTLMGKTLSGVARVAVGVPIVAFAGSFGEGVEELYSHGFVDLVPIVVGVTALEEALAGGREALADVAERTARFLLAGTARSADLL